MKITKLGHCCLVIEHKNKKILTDPGAYSDAQNEITGIDIILITHEHQDHLHIESLEMVLKNNPETKIVTNTSVGKILSEKNISFTVVEDTQSIVCETIQIEGFGSEHEEIYKQIGLVENTGYFIDNILFYPGDAFTNPGKAVKILAAPVVAPWTTFKTAMEYILKVKPEIVFPVHDGMIATGRSGPLHRLPPQILEPEGINFMALQEGESFEV